MTTNTKHKNITLNAEEKKILAGLEAGKFRTVPNLAREVRRHAAIAKNTIAKTKTVNIRISERDLMKLKANALREGLSYQTFITSVLHKAIR